MTMTFANPSIIGISAALAVMGIIFALWRWRSGQLLAIQTPVLQDLQAAEKKAGRTITRVIHTTAKWTAFAVAVSCITVALARPQSMSEETKTVKHGVDILIALDVSESMLAEDLQPNRIEAAKQYIGEFVSRLKTDRVGLLVFAGRPFTQSPMSFDYNVIQYYLSEISTATIDQQRRGLSGTAIGDAIIAAINRFKNTQERTKVLILLTDGEANVGVDPIFAAEHARSNGIKIYTIGIGDKEGAPLPVGTQNGKPVYARNRDGSLVLTKFDEETLRNIANISGGTYFYAGDNNALKQSFAAINALEKTDYEVESAVRTEDHFQIWLLLGFVAALLTAFLHFAPVVSFAPTRHS